MMRPTPHMPPALSNKALATILSVASGLAWAGPTVSGPYQGEPYGEVRFHTEGDRVIGTATGGPCGFQPGTEVISGELEGNVLAAHVLLCQKGGPQCEERELHPALIIINPRDRVLSAMIRLREGCSSPALKGNALVLKFMAPPDAKGQDEEAEATRPPAPVAPAAAARGVPDGGPPSATNRPLEVPSLEEGRRQLAAGNHAAAQAHFKAVLDKEPSSPVALVGLAASQLGLGQVPQALKTLGSASPSRPDVHLWLAYAHLKDGKRARARDSLRKAMELGWAPGNRPAEAVPEEALRADIQSLMKERNRKRGALRESTGSGSTTP